MRTSSKFISLHLGVFKKQHAIKSSSTFVTQQYPRGNIQTKATFTTTSSPLVSLPHRLGQPHYLSHPHLLEEGEVTPGIALSEYAQRRRNLVEMLPEGSICILTAAPMKMMSFDIPYRFRQHTDFLYFTGFQEPDAVGVLSKTHGFMMFVTSRDPTRELWHGPSSGVEGATLFGVDEAFPLEELSSRLPNILDGTTGVYGGGCSNSHMSTTIKQMLSNYQIPSYNITEVVHGMRVVKSDAELVLMRKAADIASEAFKKVMSTVQAGDLEWTVEAQMECDVKMMGASRLGYPPVVASGSHANILHYINNDDVLQRGELLLVDAGAEVDNYNSDITRTWPISAPFSPPQRELYEMLLDTQKQIVECCLPGTTINRLHQQTNELLTKGLRQLGLPPLLSTFYPHNIGHYLGMDVHDVNSFACHNKLKPGMCITVEPGVYIPNDSNLPERFRGIGIRIEDDIAITSNGPDILSDGITKEIDEIEFLTSSTRG